jgi:hypothetical protein
MTTLPAPPADADDANLRRRVERTLVLLAVPTVLAMRWTDAAFRTSLVTFALLAVAVAANAPSLRAHAMPGTRRAAQWLAGIVLAGAALRWLVPADVMRGNYNGYGQLRMLVAPLLGDQMGPGVPAASSTAYVPPGGAVPAALLGSLFPLGVEGLFQIGRVIGTLGILAAFAGAKAWSRDDRVALAAALVTAVDPVHVRFSASEDPMPLVAALDWLALAGLVFALRHGSPRGLALAAAALVHVAYAKLDGAVVAVALAGMAWIEWRARARGADERRALKKAALAWGGAAAALLVPLAILVWEAPNYFENPQYLGQGVSGFLWTLRKLPRMLVTENALTSLAYAPAGLTLLALTGLAAAWSARRREALVLIAYLAVLYLRFFAHFPHPLAHDGVIGDVRWNLHADVAWLLLLGRGVAWWLDRPLMRPLGARVAAGALVALSFVTTASFWTHAWADQRESRFLRASAARFAPGRPCALVTAFHNQSVDRAISVYANAPVPLLRLATGTDFPVRTVDEALRDARFPWDCAAYFRGLGCAQFGYGPEAPPALDERPECAAAEARLDLAPVAEERFEFERYSGFRVHAREVRIGLYGVAPRAGKPANLGATDGSTSPAPGTAPSTDASATTPSPQATSGDAPSKPTTSPGTP